MAGVLDKGGAKGNNMDWPCDPCMAMAGGLFFDNDRTGLSAWLEDGIWGAGLCLVCFGADTGMQGEGE